MQNDWGHAVVIDPRELTGLRDEVARLRRQSRRRAVLAVALASGLGLAAASSTAWGLRLEAVLDTTNEEHATCRAALEPSQAALAALARSQDSILSATQQAPSVGTKSWGRRFTVTKYIPRHPDYGKFNDGFTATMKKADPKERIVAVDPKLIPYGSWVWIEGLGWYRAEDCGGAIKGFRLDVLTATTADAMEYGKQDRFVLVVPPAGETEAAS
ncbi:MAG: 3D domain-containing protein [bacterium]|nr:3D domain-containing protein [bacterium]